MKVYLAPMAGVTDWAYRKICLELCPELSTITEMVSAKALCYQDKKSLRLLRLVNALEIVQIFGSEPKSMARGAEKALEISGVGALNINMGCPTPKITKNGDGSALMKAPELAGEIVREVVRAVDVPVTCKIRLGWDSGNKNAVEFAKRLEFAGASEIIVHGRTRTQMYSGYADWGAIAEVVQAVNVPVIANGDIFEHRDIARCQSITKSSGVAIGRAAMGNPFIFTGETPALSLRMDTAERHFAYMLEDKGERTAALEARKHLAWYLRGLPFANKYRRELCKISTKPDFHRIIKQIREEGD